MKAAVIDRAGGLPRFADFAEPPDGSDREIVQIVAAGIHPIVRALVSGAHYGSQAVWPQVAGVDAVARKSDGTLVYTGFPEAPWGTLAERMGAPAGGTPLPGGADPAVIAGGMNPGLASWMPLTQHVRLEPLGAVLVLGATGMAGLLAVQNARELGAPLIAAVGRSAGGLQRATELGATSTAGLTGDRDIDAEAIGRALDGRVPSVVIDLLWGAPAETAFQALTRLRSLENGAEIDYVQIGSPAGPDAAVPSALLRSRRIRISGRGLGSIPPEQLREQLPRYLQLIGVGVISVPTQTFPLSRIDEAWAASTASGRRVVVMP